MAKPTKYAPHICTAVSVCALIGIIMGLLNQSPMTIILGLLPAAIYEAYRTEGKSTKAASLLILVIIAVEIILLFLDIEFNLATYLGTSRKNIGGYLVPLGDIKVVGPTMMAALAAVLFARTRGVYTRWLAVTIFITSLTLVYTVDPVAFQELLQYVAREAFRKI
ncbi:MAG TPA: hypothetical protein ENN77_00995 [Candidatus Wirthbacteria bacterium]|nr:hypothetical protein [Candidatus Wirthbacteria bacterium]